MSRKRRRLPKGWIILAAPLILAGAVFGIILLTLPRVSELNQVNPETTALIEYRRAGGDGRQALAWVGLDQISKYLIQAVLIAEDDKFYHHGGFDLESIKQSMKRNLKQGRIVSGGSTITQQLAKNLYLNPRRTLLRKIREALLTIRLERRLSKARILEIYLNVIEFGRGIYGIKSAARYYFGKSPGFLNVEESIRLVSVLPNPSRFSPLSDRSRRMRAKRCIILKRMLQRDLIDTEEYRYLDTKFRGQ